MHMAAGFMTWLTAQDRTHGHWDFMTPTLADHSVSDRTSELIWNRHHHFPCSLTLRSFILVIVSFSYAFLSLYLTFSFSSLLACIFLSIPPTIPYMLPSHFLSLFVVLSVLLPAFSQSRQLLYFLSLLSFFFISLLFYSSFFLLSLNLGNFYIFSLCCLFSLYLCCFIRPSFCFLSISATSILSLSFFLSFFLSFCCFLIFSFCCFVYFFFLSPLSFLSWLFFFCFIFLHISQPPDIR